MSGHFIFNNDWSSLKWNNQAITDKFSSTTKDKEIILFERENNKILTCSTITITADSTDLCFTIVKGNVYMDGLVLRNLDGTEYSFTDNPIFSVKKGETMSINGLNATGIRFTNGISTRYFIEGIGFFSDDRFEGNALLYEQIREQATGTQMRVVTVNPDTVNLRFTANHTSLILEKIPNNTVLNVVDLVLGSYVNGTYYWIVTEFNGQVGFVNYNQLIPYVV